MSTITNTIQATDVACFIVEKTCQNLFLTRKVGTGMTVFHRGAHMKKKVVALAHTGITAINAMTIRSA